MRIGLLAFAVAARYVEALPVASGEEVASSSAPTTLPSTSSSSALPSPTKYTLPHEDPNPEARKAEIALKRGGFLYGPSTLGQTTFYPSGTLGTAMSQRDQALWLRDAENQTITAYREANETLRDIQSHGGLKTLDDFALLYDGHWKASVPEGIEKGMLSNYTSDLLFSMERLSNNPYSLKRLHPTKDKLPFSVEDKVVKQLTATTLAALHKAGRLFFVDHSDQKKYTPQAGRYAAACQGLFYVDARSNQFLPLAIKTNVGADLTYTPLDDKNDWLLAKIMFNNNDLFYSQMYHVLFHTVPEIVHMAAIRTLSESHPVLAVLNRIMYQAYAIRPVGERILFNPGGFWDQNLGLPATAAVDFLSSIYAHGEGGFRAGYVENNLRKRGLVGDTFGGPALPHFPFYEDAQRVLGAIRGFMQAFVDSTYGGDDGALARDFELQDWVAEANGPAQVRDFPTAPLRRREELVGILTHIAWNTGGAHHVLNQGAPVRASGVLPLHPAALYAPVPAAKGAVASSDGLLAWLPDEVKSVEQVSLLARFNRAQVRDRNQTVRNMFAAPELLAGNGEAYAAANARFVEETGRISREIEGRGFDSKGLSQGMPFIWTALNPAVNPFFLSI
uniref:Manganese lipoxygenase n=2 Tax=Nakataea oryzae TaxID=165778 RepID=MNLOX_NAKOS|nr:RecName: Full=Manganese lipoxygenase; Short=MnLOX; AltName: Full=Linoleate 9S-lipoxygenase; Short=Linoleate 9S-LOX; AltName: Full=Manganese 9S-lipoxygenase; Short=9S-MnLOX; Flags: Precursor [Nakataea oryzae]BBC44107.1 lipoxygenase [Nakataea oryzae]